MSWCDEKLTYIRLVPRLIPARFVLLADTHTLTLTCLSRLRCDIWLLLYTLTKMPSRYTPSTLGLIVIFRVERRIQTDYKQYVSVHCLTQFSV